MDGREEMVEELMSRFEKNYRESAHRLLVIILWAHLPVLTALAIVEKSSWVAAVAGTVLLSLGPTLLFVMNRSGLGTSIAIACSTMGMSALMIYLGNGRIEYHFHVFSFLAVITALSQPWAQLAAAITIALHHVLGWLIAPRAVFNYDAQFLDVLLHAVFVVIETAVCLRIVWQMRDSIRARGILEEQVSQGAEGVTSGAKEIESFVRTLAEAASSQAKMVDQVADASHRLTAEWKHKEAAAADGRRGVEDAVERIDSCQVGLESINADMVKLAEANRRVAGVMTLVTDIARQTNILAVNASIEASRSGAAGAGFGIIADQVRDLARRTAEAARDIENVLTESIHTVDRNANAIEDVTRSMGAVASASKSMARLSSQLVEMGQTQGVEMERITQAIQKISSETQQLAHGAEHSSSTTAELSRLAEDLNATLASIR